MPVSHVIFSAFPSSIFKKIGALTADDGPVFSRDTLETIQGYDDTTRLLKAYGKMGENDEKMFFARFILSIYRSKFSKFKFSLKSFSSP
jgi:hypothetical protein